MVEADSVPAVLITLHSHHRRVFVDVYPLLQIWRRRALDSARFAVRASFFAALSGFEPGLGVAGIPPGYGRVPAM